MNVFDFLDHAAQRYPGRTAVADQRRALTYAELRERATRVANAVAGEGVEPGERVGVLLGNSAEYAEVIFGLALLGVPAVHISYRLTPTEISHLLKDSSARMLIVGTEFEEKVATVREEHGWSGYVSDVAVGRGSLEGATGYEAWLERADSRAPSRRAGAESIFYYGYTSGTTGLPKGALISQRSRLLTALSACVEYTITSADVTLMCTPMHHGGPLVFVLTSVASGGTLVIAPRADTDQVGRLVETERVTNMFVVPTILNRLVRDDGDAFRRHDWSSFRLMISNAAPLATSTKEAVLQAQPELELHEFYGSTEAGIVTNLRPADQLRKVRCAGQPFMLNQVAVLDEDGNEVEPGEVGELFSASPYVFDGYNGLPEETAEMRRAGMVGVGDVAQMDDEGFFYIVDRKNDLIISGGINIYPREIEEALLRHPAVREVAVIGVPDPDWGERVKAFLVLDAGAPPPESVIAEACAELADYKRPRSFSVMDDLPKTSSGKVLKRQLREKYWRGPVKI